MFFKLIKLCTLKDGSNVYLTIIFIASRNKGLTLKTTKKSLVQNSRSSSEHVYGRRWAIQRVVVVQAQQTPRFDANWHGDGIFARQTAPMSYARGSHLEISRTEATESARGRVHCCRTCSRQSSRNMQSSYSPEMTILGI